MANKAPPAAAAISYNAIYKEQHPFTYVNKTGEKQRERETAQNAVAQEDAREEKSFSFARQLMKKFVLQLDG